MKKVLINITSYNRPDMLKNLIKQLDGYEVFVLDDNSPNPQFLYDLLNNTNKMGLCRFSKNHGKKEAYLKFTKIFNQLKRDAITFYDYFIFLPDDFTLCDDFVNKAINLWDSIEDDKKISLSFSNPNRCLKPNFTGVEPVDKGNVILTQWNDLAFICGKEFIDKVIIDPINPKRWDKNPLLSSGVGSRISNYFYNKGYNQYNVKENMCSHIGNEDSKMNPEERQINKL